LSAQQKKGGDQGRRILSYRAPGNDRGSTPALTVPAFMAPSARSAWLRWSSIRAKCIHKGMAAAASDTPIRLRRRRVRLRAVVRHRCGI